MDAKMTKPNLVWDDFRLVKVIAEAQGLATAADRLGVNHSTVFRRLGQLEEGLGIKLFERHRTGYVLTPAGEEMSALAETMEEKVETFTRKLDGQAVAPAGELRITTNDTLLVHLLTPIFSRFIQANPEMRLDVVLANQALNLSKRDADVAIRATDNPPETLVGRRVATIGWAIYGRAADFPAGDLPELATLYNRPWVVLGDNLAGLKAARFVRERVAAEKIVYKVNTVLGLAEAGGGRRGDRAPPLLHRRQETRFGAPVGREPRFLRRPVAAHAPGLAAIGPGSRLHGLRRRRDQPPEAGGRRRRETRGRSRYSAGCSALRSTGCSLIGRLIRPDAMPSATESHQTSV